MYNLQFSCPHELRLKIRRPCGLILLANNIKKPKSKQVYSNFCRTNNLEQPGTQLRLPDPVHIITKITRSIRNPV